jgi:GT2 family glycosyltransferase
VPFVPSVVTERDIALPVVGLDPTADGADRKLYCLVKFGQAPLGVVKAAHPAAGLEADALARLVTEQLRPRIAELLGDPGIDDEKLVDAMVAGRFTELATPPATPPDAGSGALVSVIVPTRGRPQELRACIESLQRQSHAHFELLVVDNAPADPRTAEVVQGLAAADPRIRYLAESKPGSSVARNTGLREAAGEFVAFTDDDVIVDAWWLAGLVSAMASDPAVAAVTGLILPAELETPAQELFEDYAGFSKGFKRKVYRRRTPGAEPLFPFVGSIFGSGNNMAFRRAELVALGGFDPALGAGSKALGGADIDTLVRVVVGGGTLVYEPTALVWHHHRRDIEALRRQMHAYGTGLTAGLVKSALNYPGFFATAAKAVPGMVRRILTSGSPRPNLAQAEAAKQLRELENRGYRQGWRTYSASVRWARRLQLAEFPEPRRGAIAEKLTAARAGATDPSG